MLIYSDDYSDNYSDDDIDYCWFLPSSKRNEGGKSCTEGYNGMSCMRNEGRR